MKTRSKPLVIKQGKFSLVGSPESFYIFSEDYEGNSLKGASKQIKGNVDLFHKVKQGKVDLKELWEKNSV